MILLYAILQVIFLIGSAVVLINFSNRDGVHEKYKFWPKLIATTWAGASLSLATAIILYYPVAITYCTAATAATAGVAFGLACWCKGSVSELGRKTGCLISRGKNC